MKKNLLTDEKLASEDWMTIASIEAVVIVILLMGILTYFLDKPTNCNADYCFDDFCIILKGAK